jgi:hypothetical protein
MKPEKLPSRQTLAQHREFLRHHLDIPLEDTATLRRCSGTLSRWAEDTCNGYIQRRELPDGQPGHCERVVTWRNTDGSWHESRHPIPDREAGALKRIAETCDRLGLHWYHQTDPRGCALYVGRVPLDEYNYSSEGIPVC